MSLEKEILKNLKTISSALKTIESNQNYKQFSKEFGFYEWNATEKKLDQLKVKNSLSLDMLLDIDKQKKVIVDNTIQFAKGNPSNNILLWGDRGTGKSSLITLAFEKVCRDFDISMIEVKNYKLENLNFLMNNLNSSEKRFIIFCDDFSFDYYERELSLFKSTLDGSLRKLPNIIFYATSNYRHMVKETKTFTSNKLNEKEKKDDISALSDRFGIWLSFPSFSKETYLKIIFNYCKFYKISIPVDVIKKKALAWRLTRGSGSGREALNFVKSLFTESF